jgi:pSer/pThr/pTyr-binding forkhead associated (FHA) protein
LGFLDSLRGFFRGKKRANPSTLRRGALPPRVPDVARQPLQRAPWGGLSTEAPIAPPSAAATELHPQPTIDSSEQSPGPSLLPQTRTPSQGDSPPRRTNPTPSASQGETRYQTALSVRGKTVGVLVAVDGELEGEVFRVPDGESRLGRSDGCEVQLPSEWISREHSKLKHQDGIFVITALTDKNPTFVNNERTEGTELKDGDFVKLGRTTFRFRTVF